MGAELVALTLGATVVEFKSGSGAIKTWAKTAWIETAANKHERVRDFMTMAVYE